MDHVYSSGKLVVNIFHPLVTVAVVGEIAVVMVMMIVCLCLEM